MKKFLSFLHDWIRFTFRDRIRKPECWKVETEEIEYFNRSKIRNYGHD